MYILWKTTGNPKWRERGWEIFKALEREAKLASGYASLRSVLKSPAPLKDEMPRYGTYVRLVYGCHTDTLAAIFLQRREQLNTYG